jgi:hypothetical protein
MTMSESCRDPLWARAVTPDLPDESSRVCENILLFRSENQAYMVAVLLPIRGAFRDRHERQQRDAMDAMTCLTKHVVAYGQAVWSCPPDAGVKFVDDFTSDGG